MTKGVSFGHPNNTVVREHMAPAGGAATTHYGHNVSRMKRLLKAVHGVVRIAGTATTHALDVYIGTSSVGQLAFSTGAAGTTVSKLLGITNTPKGLAVDAFTPCSVRTAADATGIVDVTFEFQATYDAELTE